jgi:hypothetical protein
MAALVASASFAPAIAQDDPTDLEATSEPPACAGWASLVAPPAGSRIPTCLLTSVTAEELAAQHPGLPIPPALSASDIPIFRTDDPVGDPFRLEDGSVPSGTDPATDIDATYHAVIELSGADARALRQWLTRQVPSGSPVLAGLPLRRVIGPGAWEWHFVDTAGDPTTLPEAPRVFQLGFPGSPGRSVPAVLPETNPLDGTQHIVHYRQDPTEDGSVRHSVLQTDAGSRRTGADGSVYYNTPPGHVVILSEDGVQFLVPAEVDRLGAFRPMAWDSVAWDFGSTPEAPTAFIPIDGRAPAVFDWIAVVLAHQEIADQDFSLDGAVQEGVTLPSALGYPAVSPVLTELGLPLRSDVELDFEGQELLFAPVATGLEAAPGALLIRHGLAGYGLYCLDRVSVPLADDARWPDGAFVTAPDAQILARVGAEMTRTWGTSCFRVTEAEGLHDWAAWQPWLDGLGPAPFDPEVAARMFEEAGWTDPDGD